MTKWDIRTEDAASVISISMSSGKEAEHSNSLHVKYHKQGSRGRFQSFVLIGGVPAKSTIEDVVEAYEKKRAAR